MFDLSRFIETWKKELRIPTDPNEGEKIEGDNGLLTSFALEDKNSPEDRAKQTREREELIEAKRRLSTAEKLHQDGFLLESILFCGPILRQEVSKFRRDNHGTILMRQCIMQLLLAFCEGSSDILIRHNDDYYPMRHSKFLAEVVEEVCHTSNIALLCVLRDICGYLIIENWGLKVQDRLQYILEVMEPIYLFDDPETLLALKYLAESFVFDGYHGSSPEDPSLFTKRETYIR